jgi:RNA polymerase sigma-70 factor (ECF subfamily)
MERVGIDVEYYYRRYGPMVLRRCRGLLRDEEQARDAMQDTFVNVLRHEQRLKHQAPSSLLYRIATNVCLNRIRSARRRPEDPDDERLGRIAGLEEPGERSVARRVLARLFGREPASTRTIAVLHLLDGLTLEEVAREVGLSVSGVRKRLRKLRANLAEIEGVPT